MSNKFNFMFIPKNINLKKVSSITLAFYGDAVHSILVRTYFLDKGYELSNNLHKLCSKYCSAKGQAQMLEFILPILDENDYNVIKRARNSKTHNPPKNCNLEIYKKATSLEALLGYLMIAGQEEKVFLLFEKFMSQNIL